jgi:tRNA(Ile)-lysidine synthase
MLLPDRFEKSLRQSGVIPPGSRVLVAVSGGADSIALLLLLHQVAATMQLHLEAAHLDHALRAASKDDASFVAEFCAGLDIPLTRQRREVAEIARQRKAGLEEVAREVRRDFLLSTARTRACRLIALGHHADDQAETFLLRLLRGSGVTGLAGMRMATPPFVRPLLPFCRADLVAYLQESRVAWREDASNRDTVFTRNRIRHELLPLLETFNPQISRRLAGLCEQLRQDNEFWDDRVARQLAACGRWQEGAYVLDRPQLLATAPALAGRMVRSALREARGDLRGLTASHVADVHKLAATGPPQGELHLPGVWVARRYDTLLFRKEKPEGAGPFALELDGPGLYRLPDGRTLELALAERSLGESAAVVEFAAASAPFPFLVRHWQPGDRFRPSGMTGTKKLQDLFVDLKLDREQRQAALLLLKDDDILWVVGLRRSAGRRPEAGEPVLRIVAEA